MRSDALPCPIRCKLPTMRRVLRPVGLILLWGACATSGRPASSPKAPTAPAAARVKAVAADHPLYARVEGAKLKNACAADSDCHEGGCSREVCSAEAGVVTSCEVQTWPQGDARCGCVAGECVWYRPVEAGKADFGGARHGLPCDNGRCASGLTCVSYYGIAGPGGPLLKSCEIPCAATGAKCPEGQACVTIADGPGRVCRPRP